MSYRVTSITGCASAQGFREGFPGFPARKATGNPRTAMGDQHTLFGIELRRRRGQAGMSLAELARQVHYTKGYLSKVETGSKPASEDLARLCDAALGADGALTTLMRPPNRSPAATGTGGAQEEEVWLMALSPDGASTFTALSRRQALSAGGGSMLGLGSVASGNSPGCDPSALESFAAVFGQIRQLGRQVSPKAVLPSVIAQTHALRTLAAAEPSSRRGPLLGLAARHAEYAGWLAQEAGNVPGALWWTAKAEQMAAGAADRDMAANALVRRALIAMYCDDANGTIALARRAQTHPDAGPRVHGLAALREAQGHALAGDRNACERALDRGAQLLHSAQAAQPDALMLGSVSEADPAAVTRAWCQHDLGRPTAAIEILERELPKLAAASTRSYARFGARLALSYATAGDVAQASALTLRIVGSAVAVDSATVRLELGRLARALARWSAHPQARAAHLQLVEALYQAPA
jgi:transcriptional regulator with XRE-family HTH domain